jgi:hypothetical protein
MDHRRIVDGVHGDMSRRWSVVQLVVVIAVMSVLLPIAQVTAAAGVMGETIGTIEPTDPVDTPPQQGTVFVPPVRPVRARGPLEHEPTRVIGIGTVQPPTPTAAEAEAGDGTGARGARSERRSPVRGSGEASSSAIPSTSTDPAAVDSSPPAAAPASRRHFRHSMILDPEGRTAR